MAHQIPSELSGLSQCTAEPCHLQPSKDARSLGEPWRECFPVASKPGEEEHLAKNDQICFVIWQFTINHHGKSPQVSIALGLVGKYIHKRTMFIHFELSWIALLEHVKVSPDSDPPQHIKKRLLHITKRLLRCPSGTPKSTGWLTEWGSSRATFHLLI